MATYYFHDPANRAVYKLGPVSASSQYTNHDEPPRYDGCHVSGYLTWVSAEWKKIDRLGWRYRHSHLHQHRYDQRDDAATAERYFVAAHCRMGRYTPIDRATYDKLAGEYEALAENAGQPEPEHPWPPALSRPARRPRR